MTVNLATRLASLPPEWPEDLLPAIRCQVAASRRKVVVLDDDPTGTQTVHGIPVLTQWPVDALRAELQSPLAAFFILTNSRSLAPEEASALNTEIGRSLRAASALAGAQIEIVSRSDSTLRGHFPAEVIALQAALSDTPPPCLVVPFFLEGGRLTIDDTHFVVEGDRLVPAAETAYARDAAFSYRNSDLRRWIEEKTSGRVPHQEVASIPLSAIRRAGPQDVLERLMSLDPASYCVVNAAAYRDMEVLVHALLAAEARGRSFIMRTAASFVRVRAGITPRGLLNREELSDPAGSGGGLFVAGSYVPKSSAQLAALLRQGAVRGVELRVEELLAADTRASAIADASRQVESLLRAGRDVVLFTSRRLLQGRDDLESLAIGRHISEGLVAAVRRIGCRPRFLVAKGGITASDVATKGLLVKRAMVMGQILPGVPVWKLGSEAHYPGMPYVVFPGNVGDDDALVRIWKLFRF